MVSATNKEAVMRLIFAVCIVLILASAAFGLDLTRQYDPKYPDVFRDFASFGNTSTINKVAYSPRMIKATDGTIREVLTIDIDMMGNYVYSLSNYTLR